MEIRNRKLIRKVIEQTRKELQVCPSPSECAALEILHSTAFWLNQWYDYCEKGESVPLPKLVLINAHKIL